MTQAQRLHILQHSLGLDQYGRGNQYRNYFATGEGSTDWPHCRALVADGLMTEILPSRGISSDTVFRVTVQGKDYVTQHSPAPPRLTRAQQMYRRYLAADGHMKFGDWLKRKATP